MRYLARDGYEQDDLVASGSGHLPRWANDSSSDFWAACDRYERQNGVLTRHYQFTLPRELSAQGRLDVAEDIRTVFFERYPHTWAVHCPQARDGSGENPHLHVMFSPRRDDLDRDGGPKAWFSRAASQGQDPLGGGVRKDRFWDHKAALQGVRYETAILMNAALEREGVPVAVSHDRLKGQGHGRQGIHYHQFGPTAIIDDIKEQQAVLRQQGVHAIEQTANLAAWQEQKAREHLSDLSREAMVDHVRDRFWMKDTSLAREQERDASAGRAMTRAYVSTGRERVPVSQRSSRREEDSRDLTRRWELPLIGNKNSRIYHTFEHKNYGDVHPKNQVHFWTEQEAMDAGYRRSANDHYGRGSGQAMTVEQTTRRLRQLQGKWGQSTQGHRRLALLLARTKRVIDKDAVGGALRVQLYRDKEQSQGVGW
jgi:hypothetical protein